MKILPYKNQKVPIVLELNTPCACGKYPSLPRRTKGYGICRFGDEIHGYVTCYNEESGDIIATSIHIPRL
jgi:hypothetical protein